LKKPPIASKASNSTPLPHSKKNSKTLKENKDPLNSHILKGSIPSDISNPTISALSQSPTATPTYTNGKKTKAADLETSLMKKNSKKDPICELTFKSNNI
jgi:hypothetical protein